MINILFEYPQLNCGGTEMVMYNLIKFFDPEQFHVEGISAIELWRDGNGDV